MMPHGEIGPSVRLSLHAVVWLCLGEQNPIPLERKLAALLAYLHHEGTTPRARLAGLLWPEASNDGARANLRQCIARLRKLSADVLTESANSLAVSSAVIVVLHPSPDAALLGPFDYSDCEDFGRWLQSRRQADQDSRRAALTAGIKEAAQHGNLDLAQAQADKLLELDRESENAYRALMEVAYLRGDFTVGIQVWNRCRDMLHQLYGVAPSPATRELGEMIVAAAHAGRALPSAAGATIPLSVLRPPHFIARKMELEEMLRAWRNGDQICICGEAGIGKSRLLAEFANLVGACVRVAARPGDAVQPYAALSRLVVTAIELCHPPLDNEDGRWLARLLPGITDPMPGASSAPRNVSMTLLHRMS